MARSRKKIIIDKIYEDYKPHVRRKFIAEVIELFCTKHGIRQFMIERHSFTVKHLGRFAPTKTERARYFARTRSSPERIRKGLEKTNKRRRERLERVNKHLVSKGLKPLKQLPKALAKKNLCPRWAMVAEKKSKALNTKKKC